MEKDKYKSVVFCGHAASGKTTLAKRIASIFNLEYVCAGDILKNMIKTNASGKTHVDSVDFWETEEGFEFFKKRKNDDSFDRKLDKKLLEIVEEKPVSLTSWTLPYLNCKAVRILVDVPKEERIRRLAGRDEISEEKASGAITKRDEINKEHYKKLYGFELGDDSPFDFVLDEKNKTIEEEVKIIRDFLIERGFVSV